MATHWHDPRFVRIIRFIYRGAVFGALLRAIEKQPRRRFVLVTRAPDSGHIAKRHNGERFRRPEANEVVVLIDDGLDDAIFMRIRGHEVFTHKHLGFCAVGHRESSFSFAGRRIIDSWSARGAIHLPKLMNPIPTVKSRQFEYFAAHISTYRSDKSTLPFVR